VFTPNVPAINTHYGVIKVEATFGVKVPPNKTKPSIKDSTDDAGGIYQDIFLAGIKDADYTKKYGSKLWPSGILYAFYQLVC